MRRALNVYKETMSTHWNDEEILNYGIRQLKMTALNIATILVLGGLFNLVFEGIVFAVCYILLRKVSGGFHAKTAKLCYVYSVLLYVIALLTIRYVPSYIGIEVIEIILFLITVRFLPVESENKRLNRTERNVYRRCSVLLYIILFVAGILLFIANKDSYYMSILASIAGTESLVLLKLIETAHCLGKEQRL